jgi:O-antigen/teichoic acid export membrane protein
MSDVFPDPPLPAPRGILRRVLGGTSLLVLGRIWSSLCTFISLWLLARHLEGGAFGRYTFYLAVFMLLDSLVDLGTGAVAVQRTADAPETISGVLRTTRRIRGIAGLFGVLLVGGGAFLLGEPGAPWILLASLYPVTHVLELSATVFKNRIAWGVPVAIRAAAAGSSLGFVLLLLANDVTEPGLYLCAVALGSALANFALYFAARRHLPSAASPAVPWRPILAMALPLGIAGLCQQAYFYVDNVFIRLAVGPVPLGHYNVGVRIMSLCIMVAVYAALVALPWFRREHSRGELGPAVARLAQPLFGAAGLATGLLLPWSSQILSLFGETFVDAAPSLRWLLGAAALVYLGAAMMTAIVATGRSGAVLAVAVTGLLLNLAGNAFLVPTLGIEGAAIATFATEGLVAGGAVFALMKSGVSGLSGAGGWRWAGGPLLFALGFFVSSLFVGS